MARLCWAASVGMMLVMMIMMLGLEEQGVEAAFGLQQPLKIKWHYYKRETTCKYAEEFVKHQLLRLLYSDCFVTVSNYLYYSFIFFSFYVSLFGNW
ncbi:hypothetical protein LINPERPRIM_LOCUS6575 [Linum perenne]